METKFTKEEWHIVDGYHCRYIYRRPQSDLYEYNGNNGAGVAGDKPLVTVSEGWYKDGEHGFPYEANAKLISAAPDLYNCLFDLMHQIEQDSSIVIPETHWELLDDCEKALKKATE